MPHVIVGKEFFVKELRAYASSALAFWRENFSNSLDAGADRIAIKVSDSDEKGFILVEFDDNGCGMSKEVLETVFFALGRSTKSDSSGNTGGFGRARIITLFAHERYQIRTQDNHVIGSGSEYEIQPLPRPQKGTTLRIWIDSQLWSKDHLLRMLRVFLDECDELPAQVHLNGELQTWKPIHGKWIRDLEANGLKFARVYYAKTVPYGTKAVIRVNGTAMFTRALDVPGWVIIDLIPELSRKVMTSNRDGFSDEFQNVFTRFMMELASEKRTALKPKPPNEFTLFSGNGFFTSVSPDTVSRSSGEVRDASRSFGPVRNPSDLTAIVEAESRAVRETLESLESTGFNGETLAKTLTARDAPSFRTVRDGSGRTVYRASDFLPDIPILMEHSDPKIRVRAQDFAPTNWEFRIVGGKPLWGDHGDIVRLFFAIKLIAEKGIQKLIADGHRSYVSWTVGFLFSEERSGKWMSHPDGNLILINPVKPNGILKYRMPHKQDIVALVAEVLHEVTHIVAEFHDEDFANVQTDLYGAINPWSLETEIKQL